MKLNKFHIILILLTILTSVFFRAYKINYPELNPDEAALGYNAYSLILTGKDEHGASYPLHFKSFGDFKPGGYVYLALPFVKAMGLTVAAVRIPNLILSLLTIFIFYKLSYLLSSNRSLSITAAFILSISPWHIHFSRGGWETSAALFFIVLGSYFFFKFKESHKNIYLYLFPLSLVASLYIYHSARIVAPLIGLTLVATNLTLLKKHSRVFVISIILAAILTFPVAFSFLKNGGTTRFGGVGLSADKGPLNRSEELLNHHGNTIISNRIVHNRRVLYLISWTQKYLSHFDPNFLFVYGDEVPRSKSPDMGQLHLIEFPFLILGIVLFIKSKEISSNSKLFLFCFLFIAPIASSLTFQAPSALRSLPLVIPLSFLVAYGVYSAVLLTSKYFPHNIFIISLIYIFSIYYYFDSYFLHSAKRYPYAWNSGFSLIMPIIEMQKQNYQNIYFTDTYDQPYILYLFFNRYDPARLQSQISLTPPDKFGFSTVAKIDNINFGRINYDSIPAKSLIFAGNEEVPAIPAAVHHFDNNKIGFKIYEK